MPKVKIGDLVLIDWEDHWGNNNTGWIDLSKISSDPFICRTVGWVVKLDKNSIVTSHNYDANSPSPMVAAGYAVCPRRMIVKLQILKKGDPALWRT